MHRNLYRFLLERCESADAAADFDAALVLPSRSTCDAAVAAPADVVFGGALTCDRALPAADFEPAPVEPLRRTLDALVAAFAPVTLVVISVDSYVVVVENASARTRSDLRVVLDHANRSAGLLPNYLHHTTRPS